MDKEVNNLQLLKLYSDNNFFDPIEFKMGINLILGEKYNNNTIQGRKTNGVGKSMCIEFIKFCLLSDYSRSRVKKIPIDVFPLDEYIYLEFKIAEDEFRVKRNRKEENSPIITRNNKEIRFQKLDDAKSYFSELLFKHNVSKELPSFRSFLSLFMRDENSEFSDILKTHKVNSTDLTPHFYLLHFSLEILKESINITKKIEEINKVIKNLREELTNKGQKKIGDIKSELNFLTDEVDKIEKAVDSFKSNEAFNSLENELILLEREIEKLRKTQKALKYDLERIRKLPEPEKIDDQEMKILYNEFKANLGDAIVRKIEEIVNFKNVVEEFQNTLINDKANELEKKLSVVSNRLNELDDKYSKKMKVLDKKGILKDLKTSLNIFQKKREELFRIKNLYELFEKNNNIKLNLTNKKLNTIIKLNEERTANKSITDSFGETISNIHEQIMGNKNCSFEINIKENLSTKNPIELSMRINDDGSHSINRTKVFIYDTSLLFDKVINVRHPLLLVHDNIFDVDQDTLIQSLNFLAKKEISSNRFQYILTLNRDKIETEERKKMLNLDIETHKIATFTKEKKFLKKDYQEN